MVRDQSMQPLTNPARSFALCAHVRSQIRRLIAVLHVLQEKAKRSLGEIQLRHPNHLLGDGLVLDPLLGTPLMQIWTPGLHIDLPHLQTHLRGHWALRPSASLCYTLRLG